MTNPSKPKECPKCNAPLCGCEADEAGIKHFGCRHYPDAHTSSPLEEKILERFDKKFVVKMTLSDGEKIEDLTIDEPKEIRQFISEVIAECRDEERKEVLEEVDKMFKNKDGGDCSVHYIVWKNTKSSLSNKT